MTMMLTLVMVMMSVVTAIPGAMMSSLKIESNWSQTTDSISFCVEVRQMINHQIEIVIIPNILGLE